VDIELILDSAEIMAPALKDTARRVLTANAGQMDVSLEVADVLARRAEGWPEVRITAAVGELLMHHLLATGEDVLADEESAFHDAGAHRRPGGHDQGRAAAAPRVLVLAAAS
jgi:hypothetical protein